MHNATWECINGSQPYGACWPHAEWTRPPSGKKFYIFTVNGERTDLSRAGTLISYFASLFYEHFLVPGGAWEREVNGCGMVIEPARGSLTRTRHILSLP